MNPVLAPHAVRHPWDRRGVVGPRGIGGAGGPRLVAPRQKPKKNFQARPSAAPRTPSQVQTRLNRPQGARWCHPVSTPVCRPAGRRWQEPNGHTVHEEHLAATQAQLRGHFEPLPAGPMARRGPNPQRWEFGFERSALSGHISTWEGMGVLSGPIAHATAQRIPIGSALPSAIAAIYQATGGPPQTRLIAW